MALVLPVFLLLLAVGYTGWDAMHQTIGMTSAARAGAIVAANDMQNSVSQNQALSDATVAINAEEGSGTTYKCQTSPAVGSCSASACSNDCVTLSTSTGTQSGSAGLTIDLVTITITRSMSADIPLVSGVRVAATATARYQ